MEEERQSAVEMELGVALAEAADSVRIGPLPTAAVMAGGRRRRARRRAGVAALATLAVLLPAGGFAVAVATDGEGIRSADRVAAPPAVPGLLTPLTVTLGSLKSPDGAVRKAEVTVYGAPRTKEESVRQIQLAEERGDLPRGSSTAARNTEPGSAQDDDLHLGTMLVRPSYMKGHERYTFATSLAVPKAPPGPRRERRCRQRRRPLHGSVGGQSRKPVQRGGNRLGQADQGEAQARFRSGGL